MDLKKDKNGNVVTKNDCPVYVDGQGDDVEINIDTLYKTISSLKDEAKGHRLKAKGYKQSLNLFDGIDDLTAWKDEATSAISKVADFKDKDMVAADKVSELKSEWDKSAQVATQKLLDSIKGQDDALTSKDNAIRKLLISNSFASSAFFSGKEPKTILRPDIAEARFGQHCRIEETNDGMPHVVMYTTAGMPISSIKNPAENAGFDEGMSIILDQYEGKDSILPSGNAGSGSSGGSGTQPLNSMAAMQKQHQQAMKSGNIAAAIAIKNKIYAEQQK